jgi:hypothetical protein
LITVTLPNVPEEHQHVSFDCLFAHKHHLPCARASARNVFAGWPGPGPTGRKEKAAQAYIARPPRPLIFGLFTRWFTAILARRLGSRFVRRDLSRVDRRQAASSRDLRRDHRDSLCRHDRPCRKCHLRSPGEPCNGASFRQRTTVGFDLAGTLQPRTFAAWRIQKRKRNPAVGAMLLRRRKPKANPPFTCVNMTPK